MSRRQKVPKQSDGQSRYEKTRAKTRRGGLPDPVDGPLRVTVGDGTGCDGCGEAIARPDHLYRAMVAGVPLSFHDHCYEAWFSLKR